jgi:hypothetical protein
MPSKYQTIRTALDRNAPLGQEVKWGDLYGEFVAATSSPITPEIEHILLEILRFEGELQLDENSPMTHRMSPEHMLKSLAAKALGRWTGATYLPLLQRLEATAKPASFACSIRGVIEKVRAGKETSRHSEGVAAIYAQDASFELALESGPDAQDDLIEYEMGDSVRREELVLQRDFGMTSMPRPRARRALQTA